MSVYFIRIGRYFKIGESDDPERRCANLHKGSTRYTFPADLSLRDERELFKVIDGSHEREYRVHMALDDFSIGLEWFLDEPPLREFIDALPVTSPRRPIPELPKVDRAGGWCETEYRRVQHGRAERETARFLAQRAKSA